jgi:hypothetical protein
MRALCGAIIAAGALIGLGLTALAFGIRFHGYPPELINPNSQQLYGVLSLVLILVTLLATVLIALGIAFLGLAYHHERRYRETHPDATGAAAPNWDRP